MHRRQPRTTGVTPAHRSHPARHWRLSPLARAIAASGMLVSPLWLQAAPPAASALPSGLQVAAGQATVQVQGNQMTVRNSNGAILNWSSFNIGAGAGVYFDQANAASKVLNRVTGQDPSLIFGSLASNGQVWLLNPNGVLFGQGARVDVAGLVASTLRLNDNDFLSGRLRLLGDPGSTASVRNEGSIRSAHGGQVLLLGARVENTGTVQTDGGSTTLAAASSVELVDTGLPNLAVKVDVPAGEVLNLGRLQADGGAVDVFGAMVNQQGVVRADTLVADAQGRISLKATDTLTLGAGSQTRARGDAAGTTGGRIDLQGRQVALQGDAQVDASGAAGGGSVRVGGGLQGRDASITNAHTTTVGADSSVRADALQQGQGGSVIVWADDTTRVYGTITARGGVGGGDGGFIETSGLRLLEVTRAADASSPLGLAGTWLLDPSDITIVRGTGGTLASGSFDPATTTTIGDATINAALNAGTNVTLLTSAGTGGTGAVVFNGSSDAGGAVSIANTSGGARSFTVTTTGPITVRSGASLAGSAGNSLDVTLSGSAVTIAGTVDNRGGTTTVNSTLSLTGTLRNGTLVSTAATPLVLGTGTWDGVTVGGNLTVDGSLFVSNGLTLANGVTLTKGPGTWYFSPNQTVGTTSGGSATLQSNGGTLYGAYNGNGSLTIGSGVSLLGHGNIANWNTASLINNGTIGANVAGQTLTISTSNLTNNASGVLAANGGSLTVSATNWSSTGGLAVNAGTMTLAGTYAVASINSNVTRGAGSTLVLSGVLDNTGSTVDLGSAGLFGATGTTTFSGTIRNGTLTNSVPGTVLNSSGGTLTGVTVANSVGTAGQVVFTGGLTLADGVTMTKDSSTWYFAPNTAIVTTAGGSATVQTNGGTVYGAYGGNGSLTIGSGVTLQGWGTLANWNTATVLNSGTISASATGQALNIATTGFTNSAGAVAAANGGALRIGATNWSSSGTLALNAGTLTLDGNYTIASIGTNLTRAGGTTLVIDGVLDNTGGTLDLGAASLFNSNGGTTLSGTIRNGTVTNSVPGTVLISNSGVLNGVTLGGNLSVAGSLIVTGGLTLANGVTLTKDSAGLFVAPNTAIGTTAGGSATLRLNGGVVYGAYGGNGSLTIGSGITVTGYGSFNNWSTATLVNNGTLSASTVGQTLAINTTGFTNSAGAVVAANGGTMDVGATNWSSAGGLALNSGTLTLSGNYTIASLGSNLTRNAGTTLVLGGVLDNTGGTLDLGGNALFGVSGGTTLTGTIRNGTLTNSVPGTVLTTGNNGTLSGVTLASNLSVSGNLVVTNGLTLADGVTLTKNNSTWYFGTDTTLGTTAGGSATFVTNGGTIYAAYGGNGSFTIGSGVTVRGYGSFNNWNTATVVNSGMLSATVPGQALAINTTGFTNNAGAVVAANGGIMDVGATNWSSAGSLALNTGSLVLSGNYAIASLGTSLTRNAGTTLTLGGVLDNTGGTLDLGAASLFNSNGGTTLSGTIRNGTVTNSVPGTVLTSSNGTFSGVTLGNNLSVTGALIVTNGLTLADGVTLSKDSSGSLFFAPNTAVVTSTGGSAAIQLSGTAMYGAYGGNGSLTIGTGVTVRGYGSINNWNTATLVNNGTLSADVVGQSLAVNTSGFSNSAGALAAANGGTLDLGATNWSSAGTVALNAGALLLSGNYAIASLGTNLTRNAGTTLTLGGVLDNTGGTLDLGGSALFGASGTTTLTGTIRNGTLANSVPGTALVSSNGTLDNVTLSNSLRVSGPLIVTGGLTLANGTTLSKDSAALYFAPNTTLGASSGGSATLQLNGGIVYGAYGGNGSLTVGSGITVTGYGSFNNWSTATLVNNGTLSASVPGQALAINTTTFTNNAGAVVAANGGTMDVGATNWSSAGTLALNAGTLTLSGTYSISSIGTNLTRNAGTSLLLGGVLNNANGTMDLGSSALFGNTGTTRLSGTLSGGTLTNSVAGTVLVSNNGTLSGVTLANSISVDGGLIVNGGLTLSDGVTLSKDSAALYFAPNQTIGTSAGGNAAIQLDGTTVYGAYGGVGSLTIGSGVTLRGFGTINNWSTATLVNSGTISATTPGQTLSVNTTTFTNNAGGVVAANGGTMDVSPTNWTSAGSLALNAGSMSLGGSYGSNVFLTDFSRGAGTSLVLRGTIDHTGRSMDVGSSTLFGNSGSTTLSSVTLRNGTLTSSNAGTALSGSGVTLDGITVGSNLNLAGSYVFLNGLTLANGVTLDKDGGTWTFGPNQSILVSGGGTATVNADGGTITGASGGAGTLTIGAGVTVRGFQLLNQSSALTLTNNGTLSFRSGGSISVTVFNNAGTLEGSGTVSVPTLNNTGILAPGQSQGDTTGTLAISGSLTMAAGSQLNVDVNGRLAGDFDRVTVSGTATLATGTTLNLAGTGGAVNANVLSASTLTGTFSTLNAGTFGQTPSYSATGLTLNITSNNNQGFNWVGLGVAGNWNDPLNWSTGTVPTSANTVYVGSGAGTITFSGAPATVGSLTSDANLSLPANSLLNVSGNTVLRGTVSLNGGSITGSGAITLGTGGTFNWTSGTLDATAPSTFTTQSGTTTTVTGGTLGANRSWTNQGTVNITASGFTRNGSLNHADGSLQFNGTYTSAALANLTRGAGSSLTLAGVLDNTGNTLDLASGTLFGASGSTVLTGTLRGGTLTSSVPGTAVDVSGSTFDGVTIGSNLLIAGGVTFTNGLTLADGVTLSRSGTASWLFPPNQSITTTAGGTAGLAINGGNLILAWGGAGSLTLGSGVTLRGYGAVSQSSAGSLVNNGTISADVGGQTLTLSPGTFTNNAGGVVGANGGTLSITATNWSSAGSLALTSGGMSLAGSYSSNSIATGLTRGAGTSLTLGGTIDNTSRTLDLGSIALFGSSGNTALTGTLRNGTLTDSAGGVVLTGGGTLDGVTIGSNLQTAGGFSVTNGLTLADGVTLRKDNANWFFAPNQSISTTAGGAATFTSNGGNLTVASGGAGSLTIGAGVTLQGYGLINQSSSGSLINNGTLSATAVGQALTVATNSFTNASGGVAAANGGTMSVDATNWSNAGTLAVNSGAMTLDGSYASSSITTGLTRGAGSALTLRGALNNTGTTLDLGSATLFGANGSTVFNTVTITGGTLTNSSPGSRIAGAGSPTLSGVTIGSTMAFTGNWFLVNSLTLADGVNLSKDASNWHFAPGMAISTTAGGNASFTTAGGNVYAAYSSAGSLTIGAGVTFQGYGNLSNWATATVVNNGTISASASGQTLTINTSNLNNSAGGVLASNGGTLNVASANWTNAGSLVLNAGAVTLAGNYSSAAISGTVTRAAGTTLTLGGIIDNTGRTLDVGAAGLFAATSVTTLSGTLRGGQVSNSTPGTVLSSGSNNPTLDGVTVSSNLATSGAFSFTNGLTLGNGVTLTRDSGIWYLAPNQTFSAAAGGTATLASNGGIMYAAFGGAGSFTIGAGLTLSGYTQLSQSSAATIVNNGTINANVNGQLFTIGATSFTNASGGVLAVNGGNLTLASTNWSSSGSIALNSGTLGLAGAYSSAALGAGYTRAAGSTLLLGGTLDNSTRTLDLGSSGLFGATGTTTLNGTITGGTLANSQPGTVLDSNSGLLSGVTIADSLAVSGTLLINNGLTLGNGVTLSKDGSTWYFGPNQTIGTSAGGTATLFNRGGNLVAGYQGAGTLTLGTGVTLLGYGTVSQSSAATFVNNGSLVLDAAGQTLNITTNAFTQNGTVQVASGTTLTRSAGFTNSGTIAGLGTVQVGTGTARLVNQGTLSPGSGVNRGVMTVQGDLQFGAGSVLQLDLGDVLSNDSDRLAVSGAVTGNSGSFGTLTLTRGGLLAPVSLAGDNYLLVSAASGLNTGAFDTPSLARTSQLTPSYSNTAVSLLVVPAALTVTGNAASKVYGTADPALSYNVSGLLGGDLQGDAITGQIGRAPGENAGNYGYAAGTLYSPLGYAISIAPTPRFTITPAPLTVTANDATKSFDGIAFSGGNGVTFSGLVNGDTPASVINGLTYGGTSQGAVNAGTYTIVPGGLTTGNYTVTYVPGSLLISAAALTIVNMSGTRVYDGTLTVDAGVFTLSGLRAGDDLRLTGFGLMATPGVGTDKPVDLGTLALADGTVGLASNYTLTGGTRTVTITPASLTLTGLSANNKVYDGTTTATLSGTAAVAALGNDVVTVVGTPLAQFADKNAGTAKPVTVSGLTLGGTDAANYQLVSSGTLSANITQRPVSLTGTVVANKIYDGTTTASVADLGTLNALAGDSLGVSGTVQANFSDKNVGSGKTVSLSGFTLTGTDAANYSLVSAPGSVTADITARPISVTGLVAQSRVYDTTTGVVLSGSGSIVPVAGDNVTLVGSPTGAFADKNVGSNKPVTVSGFSLAGGDAFNYSLVQPVGLSANITAASVTLSGLTAQSRVYDGGTAATFQGTASVTPLTGDNLSLTGTAVGRFADKAAGTAKPVTLTGLGLAGTDAANYVLVTPAYTADISAATLGLVNVAAADRRYDATLGAGMTGTLTGVVAGDTVSLSLTGQFADANVGSLKPVTWSAGLGGFDAANYVLGTTSGSAQASITPATLLYEATRLSTAVGQPLPTLGGSVTGFLGGDTLANATTGTLTWTTTATSASPVGAYSVIGSGLSAANYVFAQAPGNATALTLQAPTTADPVTTSISIATTASLFAVQIPVAMSTPVSGRVLDVTAAFTPPGASSGFVAVGGGAAAPAAAVPPAAVAGAGGAGASVPAAVPMSLADGRSFALRMAGEAADGVTFRPLDLSRLARDEVQSLLAARARYKQQVFSKGVYQLQQDPALADVPVCRSERDLETGTCIVTEQLKQAIQAARAAAAATQPAASVRERNRRGVKAAALPVIERKLALIIGINQYNDRQIPELVGSVPDARAVQKLLESRMGYETTLLENASRESIVKAFNKLALEAEGNDSVIIYYAGHGVLVPVNGVETGYWLPSDVDAETPSTWLSNADIGRMVAAVGARQVMLVSDSCYSGNLVGNDRVEVSRTDDASELLKRRAAVVMSSGSDEPVADEGRDGHSVFAWHFMRALESLNQWQVGGSLYERVRAGVVKDFPQTPRYGASRGAGHQGDTDYLFERRELEALK